MISSLKKVIGLGLVDKVLSFAEFKDNKNAKKTDGSKKNKINVPKLDDANWAGNKEIRSMRFNLNRSEIQLKAWL